MNFKLFFKMVIHNLPNNVNYIYQKCDNVLYMVNIFDTTYIEKR